MVQRPCLLISAFPGKGAVALRLHQIQLSVSMLAGLTTNVELLMLALDVLVEAEQLVSSTGAGVVQLVVAVLPVELECVYGCGLYFFKPFIHFRANGMSSSYVWLHTLVEFPG